MICAIILASCVTSYLRVPRCSLRGMVSFNMFTEALAYHQRFFFEHIL